MGNEEVVILVLMGGGRTLYCLIIWSLPSPRFLSVWQPLINPDDSYHSYFILPACTLRINQVRITSRLRSRQEITNTPSFSLKMSRRHSHWIRKSREGNPFVLVSNPQVTILHTSVANHSPSIHIVISSILSVQVNYIQERVTDLMIPHSHTQGIRYPGSFYPNISQISVILSLSRSLSLGAPIIQSSNDRPRRHAKYH